ncbi:MULTISPECIES: Arc family DNA-binding protein [Aurantimonas]|uniref:Arc family DNA-binding protein n=1 Tax=Aurantimonas TaxID=182269 RepID=UPI0035153F44
MSDETKYPSQLAERFQVRMPDGLRDRLRQAAEANKRSMNAEIVARLDASFDDLEPIDDAKASLRDVLQSQREVRKALLQMSATTRELSAIVYGRNRSVASPDEQARREAAEIDQRDRESRKRGTPHDDDQ